MSRERHTIRLTIGSWKREIRSESFTRRSTSLRPIWRYKKKKNPIFKKTLRGESKSWKLCTTRLKRRKRRLKLTSTKPAAKTRDSPSRRRRKTHPQGKATRRGSPVEWMPRFRLTIHVPDASRSLITKLQLKVQSMATSCK